MKRAALLIAALVIGVAVGATGTTALQDDRTPPEPAPTSTTSTPRAETEPPAAGGPAVVLAWAQGGLPPPAIDAARQAPGATGVSVVRNGNVDLVRSLDATGAPVDELTQGWRIPLDAIAVNPHEHAAVVAAADRDVVRALQPGEALLGRTSARLRRLGPGGRITLADGTELEVAAVLPDDAVGAAELVVDLATGSALGIDTPRAMLIAHDGDRAGLEAAIVAATAGLPIRFRAPGETPFLRAADAVMPQAIVKERFGEFAYRPLVGDDIELDPTWTRDHIVDANVPMLGAVRCHADTIDSLRTAMESIEAAGLADAVRVAGYDGCFVPRTTRAGAGISRHSWGIAFDLGYGENPTGAASAQRDTVVELLQQAGFTWGGTWLVPDAAHFELVW